MYEDATGRNIFVMGPVLIEQIFYCANGYIYKRIGHQAVLVYVSPLPKDRYEQQTTESEVTIHLTHWKFSYFLYNNIQ